MRAAAPTTLRAACLRVLRVYLDSLRALPKPHAYASRCLGGPDACRARARVAGDLGDTPDALVAELLAGASAAQLETVEDATLLGSARAPGTLLLDAPAVFQPLPQLTSRVFRCSRVCQGRTLGAVTGAQWRVHALALGVPDGNPVPAGGWRAAYAAAVAREAARAEALRERLRTTYATREAQKQTKRIQARQAGCL